MTSISPLTIALAIFAYLLGSIPCGLVLTRLFGGTDIRRHGSGNIGATNVTRVGGPALGLATLAGDVLKGLAPVYLALAWIPGADRSGVFPVLLALLSFFGHLFPLYTGFRGGGKGVATAGGGFALIAPLAVLAAIGCFLVAAFGSRRVSVGSLTAFLVLPVAVYLTLASVVAVTGAVLASVFVFIRHADNIRRLMAGTEPVFRLGRKAD